MATTQDDNDGIVLAGAAVVAVGAVIYAAVGRGDPRPVINIPEGFGSESTSEDQAPWNAPDPETPVEEADPDPDAGWQREDPDAPTTPDDELDFGGTLPESQQPTPPDQIDPGESEVVTYPEGESPYDSGDSGGSNDGSLSDGDPVFESGTTANTINTIGRTIPGVAPVQDWLRG